MRYQHLKIVRKISRYLVPIVPIVTAVLLLTYVTSVPDFIRSMSHNIAKPLWSIQATVVGGISEIQLSDKETLQAENRALREEVTKLRRTSYVARSLANENTHLRELLERKTDDVYQIPVSVIHSKVYSPYDTFIIDRGAESGVRDGMLVLGAEHIAVGYVQNVMERTATVRLFSASNLELDAVLHTSSSSVQHLRVYGLGGGTIVAYIPRDIKVTTTDEVTLPTFQTHVLGRVVEIENSPEDAFKKLYIKNPVNIYKLRYAYVDTTSVWKAPEKEVAEEESTSIGE